MAEVKETKKRTTKPKIEVEEEIIGGVKKITTTNSKTGETEFVMRRLTREEKMALLVGE